MSVRLFKAWMTGDFYRCDDECPEESDHYIAIPDNPATRAVLAGAKKNLANEGIEFRSELRINESLRALLSLFEEEKGGI